MDQIQTSTLNHDFCLKLIPLVTRSILLWLFHAKKLLMGFCQQVKYICQFLEEWFRKWISLFRCYLVIPRCFLVIPRCFSSFLDVFFSLLDVFLSLLDIFSSFLDIFSSFLDVFSSFLDVYILFIQSWCLYFIHSEFMFIFYTFRNNVYI